ncbi:MAG: YihY family inner membrane protein [Rhodocyclaceae bacterium]|nr:YihY family inner membrane protein [Rhodocyclaceae bacterium]
MFLPPPLRHPVDFLRQLLTAIARRYDEDRCGQVASSLSFTTLLSLVPLITVALAILTRLPQFSLAEDALRDFLLHNLLPEKAGRIIGTYALQFSEKTHRLTVLGGLGVFATALMTMLTIDHAFNAIWRVEKRRPLSKRLALYGAALVFGPLLAAVAMAAVSYFISASLGLVNEPAWLRHALFQILPVLFQTLLLALLYGVVPNCKVAPRHALAGGVAAGLLFALMQGLFGVFVAAIPTFRLVYGAFAALPIFLIWLHLSWTVVLLGALFTAVLGDEAEAGARG